MAAQASLHSVRPLALLFCLVLSRPAAARLLDDMQMVGPRSAFTQISIVAKGTRARLDRLKKRSEDATWDNPLDQEQMESALVDLDNVLEKRCPDGCITGDPGIAGAIKALGVPRRRLCPAQPFGRFPAEDLCEELASVGASSFETITSPHEPRLSAPGTLSFGLTYNYWPFDRLGDGELSDGEDFRSGLGAVHLDYSVRESLALGMTLPFVALADAPDRSRDKGPGDAAFRARFLVKESSHVDIGAEIGVQLPVGDAERGTGVGATLLRGDLTLALHHPERNLPRLHLRIGRIEDLASGADLGATETVFGVIWSEKLSSGPHPIALWADVAGGVYDDGPEEYGSLWAARLGIGTVLGRSRRHQLSFEIERRLNERGLWSSFSWQVGYGVHLQRPDR